jgi:hypothetical protein
VSPLVEQCFERIMCLSMACEERGLVRFFREHKERMAAPDMLPDNLPFEPLVPPVAEEERKSTPPSGSAATGAAAAAESAARVRPADAVTVEDLDPPTVPLVVGMAHHFLARQSVPLTPLTGYGIPAAFVAQRMPGAEDELKSALRTVHHRRYVPRASESGAARDRICLTVVCALRSPSDGHLVPEPYLPHVSRMGHV